MCVFCESLYLYNIRNLISAQTNNLACDFENSQLCGYTQDKTDVFDWTRGSGNTDSYQTGPSNDHTYTNSTGN